MFRLCTCIVCLTFALFLAFDRVQAAPTFFEDFIYGLPKAELLKRPGAMPGTEAFKDDVFFKEVPWAGFIWSAQCHFANDALEGVTLYAPYDADKLKRLSAILREQKFHLLGMVIDNTAIDILSLVKLGGKDAFKKRYRELVAAATPSSIRYEWFEGTSITEENLAMAANVSQLLTLVDMNTVQIEVSQEAVGENREQAMLAVHFSCPILRVVGEEKHPSRPVTKP